MNKPGAGQRGGFVMGLVVGLLLGLALALGVALYITKAPVPFINKVPQRTAEQDSAEIERNRNWDPNDALGPRPVPRVVAPTASGAALPPGIAPAVVPPGVLPRDPAAILADGGSPPAQAAAPKAAARPDAAAADPYVYFVQAGAYTRSEDAEQQRARLALIGQAARITEREQVGRTVYRVRLGPLETRTQAVDVQADLNEQRIDSQIVRVERP